MATQFRMLLVLVTTLVLMEVCNAQSFWLSSYEYEIIIYTLDKMPKDTARLDTIKDRMMKHDIISLTDVIVIGTALSRINDPEADELLLKIKSKFSGFK